MNKLTTEEKLNKCIEFLKKFEDYEFFEVYAEDAKYYEASDVDEFKDKIWHLLADISD